MIQRPTQKRYLMHVQTYVEAQTCRLTPSDHGYKPFGALVPAVAQQPAFVMRQSRRLVNTLLVLAGSPF
jgi:hypothetical protein